jgi:hypothetical protein
MADEITCFGYDARCVGGACVYSGGGCLFHMSTYHGLTNLPREDYTSLFDLP